MIYILSPSKKQTGGPDALQQMCYYLRKIGKDAVIVYFDYKIGENPMPDRYRIYGNKWITLDQIEDKSTNTVLSPESCTTQLNKIKKAKKVIWWLSLNWADYREYPIYRRIKNLVSYLTFQKLYPLETCYCNFSLNDCKNICGSKYAFEYLTQKLCLENVEYCVEPISLDFLNTGPYGGMERENIVLYNPAKPSDLMTDLLKNRKFNYVPLKGYTPQGLVEMFKKAKLYIDFGHFQGPERMPKEAVYFGCQILVGYRNAAKNDFDVAIPLKYKIKDMENVSYVEHAIEQMLNNYDSNISEFLSFKNKIINLEKTFIEQISNVFE